MGWVAPLTQLVGAGTQAYGQYRTGQDAADVYEYNQALAGYRSDVAQKNADIEVARVNREAGKTISRQRAIHGKSGTVPDTGSNLDALLATRREADIDVAAIRYNADLESYGFDAEANLLDTQAKQFKNASYLNVGSTLLTAAGKYDYKKKSLLKPKKPSYVPGSSAYSILPPT